MKYDYHDWTDLAVVRWSSAGLTEVMVVQRPDL